MSKNEDKRRLAYINHILNKPRIPDCSYEKCPECGHKFDVLGRHMVFFYGKWGCLEDNCRWLEE